MRSKRKHSNAKDEHPTLQQGETHQVETGNKRYIGIVSPWSSREDQHVDNMKEHEDAIPMTKITGNDTERVLAGQVRGEKLPEVLLSLLADCSHKNRNNFDINPRAA